MLAEQAVCADQQNRSVMGIYVEYLDRAFSFADLTKERKKQLGRIAELRQRRVLVIAAEVKNRLAGLSHEDLLAIGDQLSNDNGGDAIDIILETPGGSGEAAEDIVRLIRDKFTSMGVIVPGTAKSAGTILAMAGDEILMNDESAVGPIDAQILQKGKVFSAHALLLGMDQIKHEIEETGHLNRIYIPMLQNLSPGELQQARHAQEFAVGLVRKWLASYKFKDWTRHTSGEPVNDQEKHDRADEIATALSNHSRWKTHGRSIKISDLHELGLRVTNFDEDHDLADAIRRYYILLRMTFESNIFKLFETPTSQIVRYERGNITPPEVPTDAKQAQLDQAVVKLTCKKCNTVMTVQGNLARQSPLKAGHLPFPASNTLQCPTCGVAHDLIQARQQIEAQSKKLLLTPSS